MAGELFINGRLVDINQDAPFPLTFNISDIKDLNARKGNKSTTITLPGVLLKGNNEPLIMQSSHAFGDECRGLGVAEMAWSMRQGRKNRANNEMAYHALEVLHGIVKSSLTRSNQNMHSTFEKMPPLPRGYTGPDFFKSVDEIGIAL